MRACNVIVVAHITLVGMYAQPERFFVRRGITAREINNYLTRFLGRRVCLHHLGERLGDRDLVEVWDGDILHVAEETP